MNETPQTPEQMERQRAILSEFKDKQSSYPSLWSDIYKTCQEDEEFVLLGIHMSPQTAQTYGFGANYKMPNMLKPYINNQANQTLQNDYRATVTPNGGGADITKARWREGALRGIQRVGGAPEVYNYARRGQLAGGLHYSKIVVDYADARGQEKEYQYEDVQDTYSVFPDPYVQKATFSDMADFLIKEDIPRSKWEEKTGSKWTYGAQKTHPIWFYWRKTKAGTDKEYVTLDGGSVLESQLQPGADGSPDMSNIKLINGEPFAREVNSYEWEWFVIDDNGGAIYSEGAWLGCYPPLVCCSGEKIVQKTPQGVKVYYRSLAHDAKEPQMVYTICENIILLQLAKSPYPHYEISEGSILLKQLADYRDNAVIGDTDVVYREYDDQGNKVTPPRRVSPDGVDPELIALQQEQLQKIERILGIYDAALGQKTNEKSGVAIKERAKQSNLANYHFEFNFIEYVKQMGYVVLESMPNYLSVQQVIPMLDDDDKIVMQEINGPEGISFREGERYRMVIEVVPDSDSNREAEAAMLMHMVDSPILGPAIMQAKGGAAMVVKAQRGRYAQQLGKALEESSQDPEKEAMKAKIQEMQAEGKKLQEENAAMKQQKDLDFLKEQNRNAEAMAKIELEREKLAASVAKNADDTEIKAFDSETKRKQVDGLPQNPESLPMNNEAEVLV